MRVQQIYQSHCHTFLLLQARNGLENYAYSMRNTIKDANLADKLSAEDKAAIEKAVDHVVEWLDHNQVGEKMTCNERDKCLTGLHVY